MTSASASRVTRSSRSLRLAIVLFAGVLAVASVLSAQETPPAATPPTPAAAAPAAPEPGDDASAGTQPEAPAAADAQAAAAAADAPAAAANDPPPADRTRPVGPTPGRFEPTEKVRADFDVAFPIDI